MAARQLAESGRRVLAIDRRGHIGGNAYDAVDAAGVLVHRYGPHIFHTDHKRVFEYLSRFAKWREYAHRVTANAGGRCFPLPFNLRSAEIVFGRLADEMKQKLIETYGFGARITIGELLRDGDPLIQKLAGYVYENVFRHYSQKQWGESFSSLDPQVPSRVPVVVSYDDGYFFDKYQIMPEEGYTRLFENMLGHPNITVRLDTDGGEVIKVARGTIFLGGVPFEGNVIYTGMTDRLFDYEYGRLPYRTLDFSFETYDRPFQDSAVVNYTKGEKYTRITEFKHITGQSTGGATTISREYPREYTGERDIPYYPIPTPENRALYEKYAALAKEYGNLHLLGRLAGYEYINMDTAVLYALELTGRILD